jgi:pantoate--beta-alanine ligase|tara:strand:- start:33312 stop:34163 length:852 start_codon:yes stop_codon:yes gene_type:complete
MRQLTSIDEIQAFVQEKRNGGCSIGFVPTMGALHEGHLSLVQESNGKNAITIVSIFVNPTQFNNPEDLKKYPRTIDSDVKLLEEVGCDAVFIPEVATIYSDDFIPKKVDLGLLGETMEGFYRPGHFEGVVTVVQRLFSIVQPDSAFFGRKDFQQVAVIKQMVESLKLDVKIYEVETKREESGLAMSSRNMLLTEEEKIEATIIYRILSMMLVNSKTKNPSEVQQIALESFEKSTLKIEYLEIVHPRTFERLETSWVKGATVCVVAYCGKVRLIDNMEIIPLDK